MEQVPENGLGTHLQVLGLLLRNEVSANRIAIRVVALDYPSSVVGVSVSLRDQLDEKMLIEQ
jgi:hypothetical protein